MSMAHSFIKSHVIGFQGRVSVPFYKGNNLVADIPFIPALWKQEQVDINVSLSSKPAVSTYTVPGQSGIHGEAQKKKPHVPQFCRCRMELIMVPTSYNWRLIIQLMKLYSLYSL